MVFCPRSPLGNVREFGYYLTSGFPFLLTFYLGTDGLKVPGPQGLDREELDRPWYAASVMHAHATQSM